MTRAIARYEFGESGFLRQQMRLLATRRSVAWLSARLLPGIDSRVHRLTRGRVTLSALITGLPVVELQTTGARSGELRRARVLGIPSADGFLVVAANFGQAGNPAWYHNLRAHPRAFVIADRGTGEYEARELCGEEREYAFQLAISLNPGWRRLSLNPGWRRFTVFAIRLVPDREGIGLTAGADLPGAALLTGGLMLGVYTILGVVEEGWGSSRTLALGAVSVGLSRRSSPVRRALRIR